MKPTFPVLVVLALAWVPVSVFSQTILVKPPDGTLRESIRKKEQELAATRERADRLQRELDSLQSTSRKASPASVTKPAPPVPPPAPVASPPAVRKILAARFTGNAFIDPWGNALPVTLARFAPGALVTTTRGTFRLPQSISVRVAESTGNGMFLDPVENRWYRFETGKLPSGEIPHPSKAGVILKFPFRFSFSGQNAAMAWASNFRTHQGLVMKWSKRQGAWYSSQVFDNLPEAFRLANFLNRAPTSVPQEQAARARGYRYSATLDGHLELKR